MRLGETVCVAVRLVDREPLSALYALQVDEAVQRNTRRARREAEHLRSLLARERLQGAPEPHDDGVRACVAVVLGRGPPLVDVDVGGTRDEELKLALVELQ